MEEEIVVIAIDEYIDWEILLSKGCFVIPKAPPFPLRKAGYLAVYLTQNVALDKVGRIEYIAKFVEYEETRAGDLVPLFEKYDRDASWHEENPDEIVNKININTDAIIRLPNKITNSSGVRVTYKYTTFEKLLTATDVTEL